MAQARQGGLRNEHKKINMKKILFSIAILFSLNASAQKADTTIQITMSLDNFKGLLYAIDQNVDSKKTSNELISFLQKSAAIKPKEEKK